MNKQYKKELEIAEANLADARKRGEAALGRNALEHIESLLTPEEIAASNLRVAVMIEISNARRERGVSQKKLGEMIGIKQSVISRMETGRTWPQLDTILKVLAPLGKTLYVGDLNK
jgi:ribosome-binding protein aMBF1 (putative translation factor)